MRRKWTGTEVCWLRQNWHRASPTEIRERFPNVPKRIISARANSLGLKRRGIYKTAKRQPARKAQTLRFCRAHLYFQERERTLGY